MAKKPIDRERAVKRLRELEWEDLDWLEQTCRSLKGDAPGFRVFRSTGDLTHRAQAAREMNDYFDDVLSKHHGNP